ncbi:MAG: zinc metallopeptidase [Clostridiales bacterium]|nr:zinc metallopeptidase [Clostridiales bacterium]
MFEYWWLLFIAGIIMSCVAQVKVSTTFTKYSKAMSKSGMNASELARRILNVAGLEHIDIVAVRGQMTDYYDDKNGVIALSDSVRNSTSISALGVMAHEVGHALQYRDNYAPIKVRNAVGMVTNVMSRLYWPMLLIGLILDIFLYTGTSYGTTFLYIALAMFLFVTIFSLVTLPVEFNASNRAMKLLKETGALTEEELPMAKDVLTAAGMTYVASFVVSALNLLRIIMLLRRD